MDLFVNNEKTLLKMYEILFPRKTNATAFKVNSLKQMSVMKNSSDTIRLGGGPSHIAQKSDMLKGDSILQRSVDETQAGTDPLNQSTLLPSIMPAMHSIQSNELAAASSLQKSSKLHNQHSPDVMEHSGDLAYGGGILRPTNWHNKGLSLGMNMPHTNLKSMNVVNTAKNSGLQM